MITRFALELKNNLEKALGFSVFRFCGCEGFIAGRAVYEYFLYKKGKIPSYDGNSFEVYIKNDSTNIVEEMKSRGIHFSFYTDSIEDVFKNKYPLNIEKTYFDFTGLHTSPDFKKFTKTGQLEIALFACSELLVLEQLIFFEERYKEKFFLDKNKELLKLAVLNRQTPYGNKLFPIPDEWNSILKKYSEIQLKEFLYFLKTDKTECRKYFPKNRKRFSGCRKHIIEFWDVLYGGAPKLIRSNYERLKKFQMEHHFSRTGLEKLNKQIPEKDILFIKKYLTNHDLSSFVNKNDIEKTIENFIYLKLLEDDYGMEIIGYAEINNQLSLERIHDNWKKSYQSECKPMVTPLDLSELNIPNVQIRELVSRAALRKEGNDMRHCVGGYTVSLNRRIISFKYGKARSTLEINKIFNEWKIIQNRSFCNGKPCAVLLQTGNKVCEFINRKEREAREAAKKERLRLEEEEIIRKIQEEMLKKEAEVDSVKLNVKISG